MTERSTCNSPSTEKMSHRLKGHLKKGAGKVALEPESRNRCEHLQWRVSFPALSPLADKTLEMDKTISAVAK